MQSLRRGSNTGNMIGTVIGGIIFLVGLYETYAEYELDLGNFVFDVTFWEWVIVALVGLAILWFFGGRWLRNR